MKDLSILDKKANCIKTLHKKLKKFKNIEK